MTKMQHFAAIKKIYICRKCGGTEHNKYRRCIPCLKKQRAEFYLRNLDKLLAKSREYRINNLEKERTRVREYKRKQAAMTRKETVL